MKCRPNDLVKQLQVRPGNMIIYNVRRQQLFFFPLSTSLISVVVLLAMIQINKQDCLMTILDSQDFLISVLYYHNITGILFPGVRENIHLHLVIIALYCDIYSQSILRYIQHGKIVNPFRPPLATNKQDVLGFFVNCNTLSHDAVPVHYMRKWKKHFSENSQKVQNIVLPIITGSL